MKRFKSLLALVLVLMTTFLVSCGNTKGMTPPPTYTAAKLEQIEKFLAPVSAAREDMARLKSYIEAEDWTDVRNFIHGPLGDLRRDLSYLSGELLVKDQKEASKLSKSLFADFEQIDVAAKARNYDLTVQRYKEAIKDFDAFLNLIPKAEGIS